MQGETFDAEIEVYTLTDEDGQEGEFELIGSLDIDGQSYVALLPLDKDEGEEDEEDYGFVILKVTEENGEEVFVSIDDDEEFERVADAFEDELVADIDYDNEEDDDDDGNEKE